MVGRLHGALDVSENVDLGHTIRLGPMPVRIGAGMGYAVKSPDDYGMRWYFKIFIVPVIPKPIQRTLF